jgi:microcystin-dependent protein
MATPFLGQIIVVPYNFAPTGWALCNGNLLSIDQNAALFSLLGTFYGGDGTSTFALPNLQGSVPVGAGQGTGLSPYALGHSGGSATVTLSINQLPAHSHTLTGSGAVGTSATLEKSLPAIPNAVTADQLMYAPPGTNVLMNGGSVSQIGGSQPHDNMMPYLVMNFIIALQGIFPSRS